MNKDSKMIQEITAIVDSMGFLDNQEKIYKINSDTCECLKELLRLLRKDGSNFPVLRHLGSINIIEKDLIPIIKGYCLTDEALSEYTIRLLVVLTYPALVYFKEKVPNDVDQKRIYLEMNSFLRVYKIVFSDQKDFWEILCKKAVSIIKKDPIDQSEEEKILLERILILIRNILHIPKDTYLDIADEDEIFTEHLIVSLKESGTLDLILQFTSDIVSHQFCFHLLEIIYSLLRGQCPEFLATDHQSRSQHLPKKSKICANPTESLNLEHLREREKKLKILSKVSRFNRFKESTYVIKNVKSIGKKDLIYHKTIEDAHKISLDLEKKPEKTPKNRAAMTDTCTTNSISVGTTFRRPSNEVHKILKEFCESFLKGSYNSLMGYVKSALENRNAQENDETYYFFAAYFFMGFNRVAEGGPSVIEETFNFEYFHYLHSRIDFCADFVANGRADKGTVEAYSRRCHSALKAYKELLFTIVSMKNIQDEQVLLLIKEILDKLFGEVDYRELLFNLLNDFNEVKMSPSFLQDLIETNHLFLKMYEQLTNSSFSHVELFLRYSNSNVIFSYLLALNRFETNSDKLNHAIIIMFYRIACECKAPAFFYDISIFQVFQRCFKLTKIDRSNKYVEIANFARYIIRLFVKHSKKNHKLLLEILACKTKQEVREIDENYVSEPIKPRKPRRPKGQRKTSPEIVNDSDMSQDENDKDDKIADLSNDSGEGFVPLLSSTQNTQPEKPVEEISTISEQNDVINQTIGVNVSELPCEFELISAFGADQDDDDLLDMDQVLNHVADNEFDSNSPENRSNLTLVENTVINTLDVLSDAESIDGEVVAAKKKKNIFLEDSDDE